MKLLPFLFGVLPFWCIAQNTLSLDEEDSSPKADLSSITWMEGHWRGEAFGGITEEIWGPPLGGSMLFVFKHVVDKQVTFYEIGHIRELEGSLIFELKHFNTDLTGWEEKEEVQQFPLVKIDANRVYFEGFTFEKVSAQEINIYGLIGNEDGTANEVTFNYKKQ